MKEAQTEPDAAEQPAAEPKAQQTQQTQQNETEYTKYQSHERLEVELFLILVHQNHLD